MLMELCPPCSSVSVNRTPAASLVVYKMIMSRSHTNGSKLYDSSAEGLIEV